MVAAWRSADRRLSGAQAELALQEESVRRSKRECRATLDQMAVLERSLQATESELRASQVGRSGGPMGAGPRVLCGPLPETQPIGVACGSFHWANFSPLLGVHVLQGEGLGLSQTEKFRIGLKQPAVQQLPFGWGSPVIATLRLGASVSEYLHEWRCSV